MGKHEKRVYLEAIRKRYGRAQRADKGKILDEFCSVCGYQRKYAIRLLGSDLPSHHGSGRPSNTTNLRWLRCCAGYGLQPIRCAASGWWWPCHCGCPTMRCALVRWMTRPDRSLWGFPQPALTACSSRCGCSIPRACQAPGRARCSSIKFRFVPQLGHCSARLHGGGYSGALWQFSGG